MRTKTAFLLLSATIMLWTVSCSDNEKIDTSTEKPTLTSDPEDEKTVFPDATIIKKLPGINTITTLTAIGDSKIIRTQEELHKIFSPESLATFPDFNSINFSEQTLLLGSVQTPNHVTAIDYDYTKTDDSTYLCETKALEIPIVYNYENQQYIYGIIVKKLPAAAKVTFSLKEVDNIDKEATKNLIGTWKTDFESNVWANNTIIEFKEDGTIGTYDWLDGNKYYVFPKYYTYLSCLKIGIYRGEGVSVFPMLFEYELTSDTLMIYNFVVGFIDDCSIKNIAFTKISDEVIDKEVTKKF